MSLLYSRRAAPWLLLAPALALGVVFYVVPVGSFGLPESHQLERS